MTLSVGDRLGPYEILAHIGAGGMGEVWKAHDPRLGRDVAIKVSNAQFTERFAREARSIAALNHPNICTLYDVGPNYLVMEYIEGEAPKGPYALEDALRIAAQIAEALSAAHEKNIVHRDLKPGNIKIRPDGTVKVLDFGLAKMGGTPAVKAEDSPTISMAATQAGVILGTAAYMAPEQARGKPVDKRADIWAYGVVLYEMLTGERLFEGEEVTDTLAAVLTKEPDFTKIPAKARRLLQTCLQKDPRQRLQAIGDARLLLEDVRPLPDGRGSVGSRLGWVATGLAVMIGAIALWAPWRTKQATDQPLVRLDVDLGPDVSLGSQSGPDVILSPDGTRQVYVSQARLFTRRLDQPKATELAGTEGAYAPFFSPDGQWVAFFAPGKLKKVSVEGGGAIALCDANNARGGSWSEDGSIVAALTSVSGLSRIPSSGGTPTPVTELAQGEYSHRWPQVLPGGKAVLFTAHSANQGFDGANIEVMFLTDRHRKTLQRAATYGRYLATAKEAGHLIYVSRGTLFAVPFNLDKLELRGTPSPVLEQVAYSPLNGDARLDFSRSGTLVYRSGGAGGELTVQWLDGAGKMQPLLVKPGFYTYPRLSPDGQRLALTIAEGLNLDLWIYEWQRDTMTRLTFGGSNNSPVWSADGRYIVFQTSGGISWIRSDGAGKPQPLIQSKNQLFPWSLTANGKRLSFQEGDPGTGYDIWTLPLESDDAGLRAGKPELFLRTPFAEWQSSLSPDGRWLAYSSNESGSYQVYVRAFPDKGGQWQVSNGGGVYPEWSRTGSELFFHTVDNQMMVATYTVKGDSFAVDKPRVWSEKRLADVGFNRNYALAPDGKRIAALMPAEGPEEKAQNHVIFLLNFFDEVRRRTAVK